MSDSDHSCVYGLRQQARCLTSVTASTETSKFLVGTVGTRNNVICLLEYDDDTSSISPTLFDHPDEVWDVVSCPFDEQLLLTTHSPASIRTKGKKVTLWKQHIQQDNIGTLEALVELEHPANRTLWNAKETSRILSLDSKWLHLSTLDESNAKTSLSIDTSSLFDPSSLQQLQNAVWNPHDAEQVVTVGDQCVAGWDLRSAKTTFKKNNAHASTIRAVDYNTNKPHHIVTGGDDAQVNLWDLRQVDQPIAVVEGHTHWVWSVALNKFHDQLLLTSSSDTLVNLQNVISASSASYFEHESDDQNQDAAYWKNYKPADGLICTYDQHEDSVYAVEWSPADTWTFASLSYAGRIIINQVPTGEKFKILGV
ncbi:WD40-repeat-containing domain protein [Chlamydoabsidia padenii]|nr:WD40-repeat-containing domain protein [Chlamydoabsidia padenii]